MDTASSAVRMARQECADALSVAEVGMAAYMSYGCTVHQVTTGASHCRRLHTCLTDVAFLDIAGAFHSV
jgi:hypothetical protein